MALKNFSVDLHIHTCLSPCADPGMLPGVVVGEARRKKLDCIGVCDHNSAENVAAVKRAAARTGLLVWGGMEITSREEVHILTVFEDDAALQEMQRVVYAGLTGENVPSRFGDQMLADAEDKIVGINTRALIGATSLGVGEIVESARGLGGLVIASHVDRQAFGILGQLGFVPEGLRLDALELSPNVERGRISEYRRHGLPLVTFSDAHFPADIGKSFTTLTMECSSISEAVMALRGVDGRSVRI